MKKIKISLRSICCLLLYSCATPPAEQLPQDPSVRTGQLANGLTYYVRQNGEPKERASFYIIQKVGAILEEDNQNGLAHFLEHMAFNGTKNFPGRKGVVNVLEKHGIEFGNNLNAYTSLDETVYNISEVPTHNESLLDTCLLVLHDWSHYLNLMEEEIDAERRVITEEWRTRHNSAFRLQSQINSVLLKDSKYALRDVIGDLQVINHFDYQTLRDYYHKWYRPDLQAIVVVGDIDPEEMEQKIQALFSPIPKAIHPAPREYFNIPLQKNTQYICATDPEATQSVISVYMRKEASKIDKNSPGYLRENLIHSIYNILVSQRISELLHRPNPPLIQGGSGVSEIMPDMPVYEMYAVAIPDQEAEALEAIYKENVRIRKHGFIAKELDRVKASLLAGLESKYKQKDKIHNEQFVADIQNHFLYKKPLLDIDTYYQQVKKILPTITTEEIDAVARQYFTDKNMTIVVKGPSEGVQHLTQEEALEVMKKVRESNMEAYSEKKIATSLIEDKTLPGSKIVNTRKNPTFDAEEWTLENGAKIIFRKTDYEKDLISVNAYSKGGSSLYEKDKLPSALVVSQFMGAYGLGNFNAIQLKKALSGKQVNAGIGIEGLSESLGGNSTPQDFETLLQILYLFFEHPRFDPEAHRSLMDRNYASIANMRNNPQKTIKDSVSMIMNNYHPRVILFNKEFLDAIRIETIEEIYRDRFKDASDFLFVIVGNLEAEEVKPLIEKYIGSIKSCHRQENWKDNQVRGPQGHIRKNIHIDFKEPKATVINRYEKSLTYSVANNIYLEILRGILELRYTENIREKEGGTYGVNVGTNTSDEPYPLYQLHINFDCKPERASQLNTLIQQEIQQIIQKGPDEKDLHKVIVTLKKNEEQARQHNSYWENVLSVYYLKKIDLTDPNNFEHILDRITPETIQKFTRDFWKDANRIELIFTSAKAESKK